jgi:hypothetical protein
MGYVDDPQTAEATSSREALYQAQYGLYVSPYLELAKESYRLADAYTHTIVRTAFVLNGGGITFLPALAALRFERADLSLLPLSFAMFATGLFLAVVFALFCRQNLYIVLDQYELDAERERRRIAQRLGVEHVSSGPPGCQEFAEQALDVSERRIKRAERFSYRSAYVFGILTYMAFGAGALIATKATLGRWVWPVELWHALVN